MKNTFVVDYSCMMHICSEKQLGYQFIIPISYQQCHRAHPLMRRKHFLDLLDFQLNCFDTAINFNFFTFSDRLFSSSVKTSTNNPI